MTRRTLALSSTAALGAALALALTGAPAALAATLPASDTAVVVNWSGQLYTTDPATGELTALGTSPVDSDEFAGLDVDSTGVGYGVTFTGASDLVPVDLTTGVYGTPVPITLASGDAVSRCTALDLSPAGVLTAACDGPTTTVGTIDPATAVFTPLATTLSRVAALATNPVTGILYAFEYDSDVYTLDPATGDTELVGEAEVYGVDFDSAGIAWYTNWNSMGTIDPATWIATPLVAVLPDGDALESEAITVWSAAVELEPVVEAPVAAAPAAVVAAPAVLANTGTDTAPLVAAAGLLLALGAAALTLRARRSA